MCGTEEKVAMAGLKFETGLKKLEEIVNDLEQGDLDLEKSLDKFEEGVKLTKICTQKLDLAEKKIELLMKEKGGIRNVPFNPEQDPVEE